MKKRNEKAKVTFNEFMKETGILMLVIAALYIGILCIAYSVGVRL